MRKEKYLLEHKIEKLKELENINFTKNKELQEKFDKAIKIAAKERHLRINKKVNYKMLDSTIKKIKEDNDLSI